MNFSSDHVEPIKADHGTQPPPPTSSTFFVLSLFPPRVLAFIHPLSAPPPSQPHTSAGARALFLGFCSLFPLSRSVPSRRAHPDNPLRPDAARPLPFTSVFLLLPLVRPLARSHARSLSGNSLDFFASRGGVIYLAEVERGTHGGGRRSARGGAAGWVTADYVGYQRQGRERGRAEKGIAGE